jgi:UDP-glucose 4-epimerase
MLKNKKILVTGAAGFIGSNLVDKLLELENKVVGIDNLLTGKLSNLEYAQKFDSFKFIKTDFKRENFYNNLKEDEYDIIFHQGALPSVTKSVLDPTSTNENNLNGTLNVLKYATDFGVDKIIYASSSSVYGDSPTLPKIESMRTKPISPYGVSKLAGECYCHAFYRTYGLKTVALRYFNVYGPRQSFNEYSGVITIFLNEILAGNNPKIFGDGKQSRDFTFIDDVIQANLLAAEIKNTEGQVFNIANGQQTSILKLANEMIKLLGKKNLKPIFTDPRPGDILHSLADISKARKNLGYNPKYSLESGIKSYLNWIIDK